MKIVSWNCNGVFREDFKVVQEEIDPDIYVIQECENPKKEGNEFVDYSKFAGEEKVDYFWVGNKRGDKGLGVFKKCNSDITLEEIKICGNCKHFIAVRVNDSFNLLGVWAMDKDKELGLNPYVEMIHDFLDVNNDNDELFGDTLIICGDFNSSAVFNPKHTYKRTHRDMNGNPKNHTCLDCKLNKKGLVSVYHELTKEKSGEEKQVTFFQARHLNNPYHLDYVYATKELVEGKTTFTKNGEKVNDLPNEFEIWDHWAWVSLSDHLPIVFTFDEKNLEKWKKEKVDDDEYSNIEKECKESVFNIN